MDALTRAYPAGHTAKELTKFTKQSSSHIYRNLSNLERENYLIKIPGERDKGRKPSQLHIIEESSGLFQTIFDYELSPTCVKLSDDFKNAWGTLVSKKDEADILREMMLFIQKIVRRTRESDKEAIKKIAPNFEKTIAVKTVG